MRFEDVEDVMRENKSKNKYGLRSKCETILPPRSQNIVEMTVKCVMPIPQTILTVPMNFTSSVLVANSVSQVEDGISECVLLNLENKYVQIPADTQLGTFESIELHEQEYVNAVSSQLEVANTKEIVRVGEKLSEAQIAELSEVLENNVDAFSMRGQLGLTDVLEHHIELAPDAKPKAEPLRRRPQAHKVETDRQVKEMLKQNIIEESDSPWASAYVLVKKKTGELRLCIDFRPLNTVTKKTSYPLPNAEDCLEPLCGNKFFTQLDLASGFWQIPMAPESKE